MLYRLTYICAKKLGFKSLTKQMSTDFGWQKKYLAYPIKGYDNAYYRNAILDIKPKQARKIIKKLQKSHAILRHLLVKIKPEQVKTIAKNIKFKPKIDKETKLDKLQMAKQAISVKKAESQAAKRKKVDSKQIDKKLEEILGE